MSEAISVSAQLVSDVFEIVGAHDGSEALSVLKIDPRKVEAAPYPGCYWLVDGLLIGPNPICPYPDETHNRLEALRGAGVQCVVSLLTRDELLWSDEQDNQDWLESFEHHVFPIRDGGTPPEATMKLILNVIDRHVSRNVVTLLHCWGGRGRSGLVAACYVARHGIATGQRALNFVAKARFEAGQFTPSPETDVQAEFARNWKEES